MGALNNNLLNDYVPPRHHYHTRLQVNRQLVDLNEELEQAQLLNVIIEENNDDNMMEPLMQLNDGVRRNNKGKMSKL